jgi:hypothetical protein
MSIEIKASKRPVYSVDLPIQQNVWELPSLPRKECVNLADF